MANTITGKILHIFPTQQIDLRNGGQPFLKREIVIDATRFNPYTGERDRFENTPLLEFSGERCAELDRYSPGQIVTISFDLQGRNWLNKDGQTKYITSVRAYRIEFAKIHQASGQIQQPAPQVQQETPPPADFPPPVGNDGLPF